MTTAFNARIIIVTIIIDGVPQVFQSNGAVPGLDIRAYGQHNATPESSICTIKISNLTRDQKNKIMTGASPMTISQNPDRKPIPVTLSVGRVNTFTPFQLFSGTCWASAVTAPPDITVILTSTTQNLAAASLQPVNQGALTTIGGIALGISNFYGLVLNIDTDLIGKQIANFNYTGGLQSALNKLARCGDLRVHIEGSVLNVYDIGDARPGVQPFILNLQNNMIGIPEAVEMGVNARMLIRPEVKIGGPITIQSAVNPAVNGNYFISTMAFNVASRDDPFWYDLYCGNNNYIQGGQ